MRDKVRDQCLGKAALAYRAYRSTGRTTVPGWGGSMCSILSLSDQFKEQRGHSWNFQRPPLNHSYVSATKMFQLQVSDHGTSLLKNIEWIPFSIKCNKNNSTGKQQQALHNLALKTSYYLAAIALPALPFSLSTPVCSDQALHSCSFRQCTGPFKHCHSWSLLWWHTWE